MLDERDGALGVQADAGDDGHEHGAGELALLAPRVHPEEIGHGAVLDAAFAEVEIDGGELLLRLIDFAGRVAVKDLAVVIFELRDAALAGLPVAAAPKRTPYQSLSKRPSSSSSLFQMVLSMPVEPTRWPTRPKPWMQSAF